MMKLTCVIILMALMQVSAATFGQNLTLKEKNVSISKVFFEIRKQTGYDILVKSDRLNTSQRIDAAFNNVPVTDVLEQLLKGKELQYSFNNKIITITLKEKPLIDRIIDHFQDIDVKGRLVDENGQPLAGASVLIKGTERKIMTNENGEFSFTNLDEKAVLVISFIGYEVKEVLAKSDLGTIKMSVNTGKLGEVSIVSTGYQKVRKEQMAGAVSTISEKQYQQRVAITGDFLESLEGKTPGLVYNPQTGDLTIRGVSTFDAVKRPLIILDGFPTEIDLRTINPQDIVSINVLRDAAAASIYGVRASNGVIVVETRRGKSGKPKFHITNTYAVQNKPDFGYLNYASGAEVVHLQTEEFKKRNPSSLFYYLFGLQEANPVEEILFGKTEPLASFPLLTEEEANAKLAALASYDNLQDYERLFYQNRTTQNINIDMSGGGENSTYILGANFINETPVQKRSENNQFNLNIANTFKISDRFNLDTKGTYTYSKNSRGNTPSLSDFFPYERLVDENGIALPVKLSPRKEYFYSASESANNANMAKGLPDLFYYPFRELYSNTTSLKGSAIRFQARLNTKITEWLNVDIGGNYEEQNKITDQLQLQDSYEIRRLLAFSATRNPGTGLAAYTNLPEGDVLKKENQKLTNYTVRTQLNLAHAFNEGEHDLSGIFGVEQRNTFVKGNLTTYFGYDGQSLISKPVNLGILNSEPSSPFGGFGNPTIGSLFFDSADYFNQSETDRRFQSYYGQGTYIFNGKYTATGSFRIDKSNLFGADPKYKNKPLWSTGLSWNVGKENFIRNQEWINYLQLRAATGFNGNIPNSYNGSFLILETSLNTTLNQPIIYNDILTPENQSLRWETTNNYNIGLDYGLLNSRISGSIDWYLKKTTDVFGEFNSDPTSGFNSYNANTASIENRGFEVLINSLNMSSEKFQWNTQLTASFNNNKVLAVKTTELSTSNAIVKNTNPVKGKPIGALYSYHYGGLNSLGQPFVYDKGGNEIIIAGSGQQIVDVELEDLIYNGTVTPKYVLGLNNQFKIGDFNLSFLFMYYGGHVMRVEQPDPNSTTFYANNPLKGSSDFWREPGDENKTIIPGYGPGSSSAEGYYSSFALDAYGYASQFVRKADHIRLRDIVLTYNLKQVDKYLELNNTQLRLQAQNVFNYTFSGNDIDPDAINRNTGIRTLQTQPFYSITFSTNF